jgi:hypothetical protein
MDEDIDPECLKRTFGFHGFPLIKVWNEEQDSSILSRLNIQPDTIDTNVYVSRQKFLVNVERTKRLRLHKFICHRAQEILHKDNSNSLTTSRSNS